jgi:DNA-binding NtrC family response regulator
MTPYVGKDHAANTSVVSALIASLKDSDRREDRRRHGPSAVLADVSDFHDVSAERRETILIIEDDAEMRAILEETLERAGYMAVVAKSGAEGIRLHRSEPSDLVILDVFMRDKDGLETLMEIRRHMPQAKVLMISGGGTLKLKHVLVWARRLGASATLAKPFTPAELLRLVSRVLEETRKEEN